jgi:hypothetical protein
MVALMNLSDLKELYIDGIKLVELSIDGIKVWSMKAQSYTNVLPLATDNDRKTIYGEKGYRSGYRLSSSGGGIVSASGMCASGFIPCKVGDVLRIKGTKPKYGTASYVMSFDSSNTRVADDNLGQQGTDNPTWVDKDEGGYGCADYNVATDTLTIVLDSATFGTGWDAVRFCAGVIDDNTIVTINERMTTFKNWVGYSTESDGKTIYNGGLGYKDGYRVRSGGAEAVLDYATCTGFIPFKKGDILRIFPAFTGQNTQNAINFSDASRTNIGQQTATSSYGICLTNQSLWLESINNVVDGVSVIDISNIPNADDVAYIRVTNYIERVAISSGAEMIVTINEEIK